MLFTYFKVGASFLTDDMMNVTENRETKEEENNTFFS